jgi:hypothetical protein
MPRLDAWVVTHQHPRELRRVGALFDDLVKGFRPYQAIGARCGASAQVA